MLRRAFVRALRCRFCSASASLIAFYSRFSSFSRFLVTMSMIDLVVLEGFCRCLEMLVWPIAA